MGPGDGRKPPTVHASPVLCVLPMNFAYWKEGATYQGVSPPEAGPYHLQLRPDVSMRGVRTL